MVETIVGGVLIAGLIVWFLLDWWRGFPDNRTDTEKFDAWMHGDR